MMSNIAVPVDRRRAAPPRSSDLVRRQDSNASVIHFDKDGKRRIHAVTLADGTAQITRKDVTVKE